MHIAISAQVMLSQFIEKLQSTGRYTFDKFEALKYLNCSPVAFKLAAQRLSKKGKLLAIKRGFFLIIPTEYLARVPSPSWYIEDLMKLSGRPYYVGLLSAAALHGVAPHQPQEFQVISDRAIRRIEKGQVNIRFFQKAGPLTFFLEERKTPTGIMKVSTPEFTALDLVGYASKIGGLDLVGSIIYSLGELLHSKKLLAVVKQCPSVANVQRLGYILEHLGFKNLVAPLAQLSQVRQAPFTLLANYSKIQAGVRNKRWGLILNQELEIER